MFTPQALAAVAKHFARICNATNGSLLGSEVCPPPSGLPNNSFGLLGTGAYPHSDLVAVTNSRAIVIGSANVSALSPNDAT